MTEILKKIVYYVLLLFIGLFIGSSFFIRAKYNFYKYGDHPILQKQNIGLFILLFVLLAVSSIVLYRLCLKLNKYSEKIIIPVTLLFSFAIQLTIIFLFTVVPTADSRRLLSLALDMLYRKDYSTFLTGGYLFMFPFNSSYVFYLKTLLEIFPDNYLVLKIFNILFSLVTTLMIYLIYKEIDNKPKENDYGVFLLAATFIPSLFMCNYIYNDIISTTLITSSIYFFIRFVKYKSIKYIMIASILLSIGNYFRSIGIIILIAAVIYILMSARNIGLKKVVLAIAIVVVLIQIPNKIQDLVLQKTNIVSESIYKNSAPAYLWLNMGINMRTYGFWDSHQSYNIYRYEGNYNKHESAGLFIENIKNKLSSESFIDIIKMYYKKIIWTWTEGTYQIDRYGFGNDFSSSHRRTRMDSILGGYSYSTFATDLLKGDSKYRNAILWMIYVNSFLMYCFIFTRLIKQVKVKRFDEVFLILVVLGFIGFYILWEIKSRYIYPVYPLLIILSYMGLKDTYDYIIKRKNPLSLRSFRKRNE